MRKVILNMQENEKYLTIKKVVEGKTSKKRAAVHLNVTLRHINRMIIKYKEQGKAAFVHGNYNRTPKNHLPAELKQQILDLYKEKYDGGNFTHFTELLASKEGIEVSRTTVASILGNAGILSPKAQRSTKKCHKQKLRAQLKEEKKKSTRIKIENKLLNLEDAHPSRPRKKYFGEQIQMDASLHGWFGQEKSTLHAAIDDATGCIVGAYFDKEETLNGYYQVFHQILTNYGIPYEFFTDRRTVFEYERKAKKTLEEDTFTQFGYACQQLGTTIRTSSVPQAKGRVERLFNTLQSRLIMELKIHDIQNIADANEFLNSYIKKFNAQFAMEINYNMSVFEKAPTPAKLNLILGILSTRKIDHGHHFKFHNACYQPVSSTGKEAYFKSGTGVLVIQAFDSRLFATIDENVYALRKLEANEQHSKELDPPVAEKNKRVYIPPMSHPWKAASFNRYLKSIGKTQAEFDCERSA